MSGGGAFGVLRGLSQREGVWLVAGEPAVQPTVRAFLFSLRVVCRRARCRTDPEYSFASKDFEVSMVADGGRFARPLVWPGAQMSKVSLTESRTRERDLSPALEVGVGEDRSAKVAPGSLKSGLSRVGSVETSVALDDVSATAMGSQASWYYRPQTAVARLRSYVEGEYEVAAECAQPSPDAPLSVEVHLSVGPTVTLDSAGEAVSALRSAALKVKCFFAGETPPVPGVASWRWTEKPGD